jgi:diguanylate cyclase (GGDEF)-like protein
MPAISIKSLMSTRVQCAGRATSFSEIVQRMRERRHSCIVITESGIPVGIITERDLVRYLHEIIHGNRNYEVTAAALMSASLVTVAETASLADALALTRARGIRHLPVVDFEGKLAGVVTQTDLVGAQSRALREQNERLEQAVAERTRELMNANARLLELCMEDGLLGIGNRRAMEVDLLHTHAAARRYGRTYAAILCDIDHFKLYNDLYGHAAGDTALRKIAEVLRGNIRTSDRIYRYGGEELLLLLPDTGRAGAQTLGQKLLQAVAQCAIPHKCHAPGIVTFSGGIAALDEQSADASWEDLLQAADRALYRAKHAGRNRIV